MTEINRDLLREQRLTEQLKLWEVEKTLLATQPRKNFLQRAWAWLTVPYAVYTNNAWVIDFSHWDYYIDWDAVAKVADAVILKMGGSDGGDIYFDETFADRVQQAYQRGIMVIGYWFIGPVYWIIRQRSLGTIQVLPDESNDVLQAILKQLHAGTTGWKAVQGIAFDVEEASIDPTKQVTPPWVRYFTSGLVDGLRRQTVSKKTPYRYGVYSRANFMDVNGTDANSPGKGLSTWLSTQPDMFIWEAKWVNFTPQTTTLANMKANFRPGDTYKPLGFGYSTVREVADGNWQIAQYNGEMVSTNEVTNDKGAPMPIDMNIARWDRAGLYKYFNFAPTLPTPTCPIGQHWDEVQGKCVEDVVVPPPDNDEELEERIAALEAMVQPLVVLVNKIDTFLKSLPIYK